MEEANDEEQQDLFLISRVFIMNFATIHTSSSVSNLSNFRQKIVNIFQQLQTATQALFDLAAFPEYVEPLREEIEAAIKQEGWTKAALDQMHKLDSFIKESQRLHPVGACT